MSAPSTPAQPNPEAGGTWDTRVEDYLPPRTYRDKLLDSAPRLLRESLELATLFILLGLVWYTMVDYATGRALGLIAFPVVFVIVTAMALLDVRRHR